MLVATVILGVAVASLLGGLSDSLKNAGRLSSYDKATIGARQKMEEILADPLFPRFVEMSGPLAPGITWRARMTPFDAPQQAGPGVAVVDRLELEALWRSGNQQKSIRLEGYRRGYLGPNDFEGGFLRQ